MTYYTSIELPERRTVSVSANDNISGNVHPLSAADMAAVIEEHGRDIGATIDRLARESDPADKPYKTFMEVLLALPELQRWVVWYGSDLKRQEVDQIEEGRKLFEACFQVVVSTRAGYSAECIAQVLLDSVREFSNYLMLEAAHR
ncbi:hypothetical protein KZ810_07185 [Sphingomonas sp. RHCKR47]|uniref:hypothetical protein n=1 Tax=Sphingomonas citricola TaxID=2862498 RepID=UPI001CA4D62B|nr:hypothetical protein [Sphingomonas citricola]MBW6523281.1 hypothetical protein [Sphingomonas citricola]